jgi:putative ubiquitin-RnfH superfamily antitoxin RatB of RatAB toxin-antitoxin module
MANADPAGTAGEDGLLRVEVAYSPAAGQVDHVVLRLPRGATVAQALHASGLLARHPQLAGAGLALGIWGRRAEPEALLRDRDRVEVYRPLTVDPKEARRLRYRGQPKKTRKPIARRPSGGD